MALVALRVFLDDTIGVCKSLISNPVDKLPCDHTTSKSTDFDYYINLHTANENFNELITQFKRRTTATHSTSLLSSLWCQQDEF